MVCICRAHLLDVSRAFFCSPHWLESELTALLRNACGCHRYLLHRLGGLGPELAELAWSGPLCTQLQHTRQETQIRASVRERERTSVRAADKSRIIHVGAKFETEEYSY